MSSARVKICGLTSPDAVLAAADAGADFIGFVFFPASPRHVEPARAAALAAFAPHLPSVAVTVNATDAELEAILGSFRPDYIQLHGQESPERVHEVKWRFGLPVIKALSIHSGEDLFPAASYEAEADHLMFDAKAPAGALPGGNGMSFDWSLLAGLSLRSAWFLSGGLREDNVQDALRRTQAPLLDVSSGVESSPGIKSTALIQSFISKVRALS